MIKISLTDLVDVATKSGTPKATKVAEVKRRTTTTIEALISISKSARRSLSSTGQTVMAVRFVHSCRR